MALDKAFDMGLFVKWVPVKESITLVTLYLNGHNKYNCVENFVIDHVHNALKHTRIISDDDLKCRRYIVRGELSAIWETGIIVIEATPGEITWKGMKVSELTLR